jgi:hypothetical protein
MMKPVDLRSSASLEAMLGLLPGEAAGLKQLKPLSVPVKVGCELIGISSSTMWKYIKDGRVKTISLGRKRLIIYESLEALVQSAQAGPRLEEILAE